MNNMELGKLYSNNDMVKVGCHDCMGCSSCCEDMGQSIWLDPYDIYQMTLGLGRTFEELLEREVAFHVEEGLIIPHIRMIGGPAELAAEAPKCGFLDENERCGIHSYRPGFCRLFPLGRNYDEGKLTYFLLENACRVQNKSKMKVSKWLGVPKLKTYESFLVKWHGLTKGLRAFYGDHVQEEAVMKAINMQFLQIFYLTPYDEKDFYEQFEERFGHMHSFLLQLGVVL